MNKLLSIPGLAIMKRLPFCSRSRAHLPCLLAGLCLTLGSATASVAEPAASPRPSSFVLFDQAVTHRGDHQMHLNWDFQTGIPTNPDAPTNWLAPESPFFGQGLYHFRVEVRRMERAWTSPMTVQFGWWNIASDPVIRHIASPTVRLTNLTPPAPDRPWVYEQIGTLRSLDPNHMYFGAGPNNGKKVADWDWHQAFAGNTAYTLINPRDNKLDADGDGTISESEYPDLEMHVVLTIHGPSSIPSTSLKMDPHLASLPGTFELQILDKAIREPWLKTFGDLNGDGRPDLVIGGARASGGGLVAFINEYPRWRREVVDATRAFSTDGEVADIDSDGRNDIVAILYKSGGLAWYQNGPRGWLIQPVATNTLHDLEVADLDGDGLPDLVGRNQKEWPAPNDNGNRLHFCWQGREGRNVSWGQTTLPCPPGEGLLVTDVDGDGRPDIVINQRWYENLGSRRWAEHVFAADAHWKHPNTFIAAGDFNGDGRRDLVLSPSELKGGRYKVSWFEAPANPRTGPWTEHLVVTNVETVVHFVGAADFDRDGRVDIATAAMPQSNGPAEVTTFFNRGVTQSGRWVDDWSPLVISVDGSHSMRIVDADGDGFPDLFGANWSAQGRDENVKLWLNRLDRSKAVRKP